GAQPRPDGGFRLADRRRPDHRPGGPSLAGRPPLHRALHRSILGAWPSPAGGPGRASQPAFPAQQLGRPRPPSHAAHHRSGDASPRPRPREDGLAARANVMDTVRGTPVRPGKDGDARCWRRKMRILLTGSRGYIGSVMAPFLVHAGNDVVGIDTDLYRRST